MPRDRLTRRAFARAAGAVVIGSALWPTTARASLFGEENASLLAILAELLQQVEQAIRTVDGVFQTVDGVFQTVNHLITVEQQGATTLTHLKNIEDIHSLLNFALSAVHSLQRIDRDVIWLGYKFDLIDQQHEKVFPTRASMQSMPSTDFPAQSRQWNDALRESTVVAMRAQTSIESLDSRAKAQQQFLDASKNADGVVGQLQAVVSALSLLHSDMAALEANLAAGMRVTAAWASQQAAEKDLREEDHRRMMEGYTDEDPPGDVLTELP